MTAAERAAREPYIIKAEKREERYARESMEGFMDTVHRMMRLVTRIEVAVEVLNALLLFGVGYVAIGQKRAEAGLFGLPAGEGDGQPLADRRARSPTAAIVPSQLHRRPLRRWTTVPPAVPSSAGSFTR